MDFQSIPAGSGIEEGIRIEEKGGKSLHIIGEIAGPKRPGHL